MPTPVFGPISAANKIMTTFTIRRGTPCHVRRVESLEWRPHVSSESTRFRFAIRWQIGELRKALKKQFGGFPGELIETTPQVTDRYQGEPNQFHIPVQECAVSTE